MQDNNHTPSTLVPPVPITEYLSRLVKQDGLYVGLGLGAVCGGLLATQDVMTAMRKAADLLTVVEQLISKLQQDDAVIDL